MQERKAQKKIDMNTKLVYNIPKPRNLVAKDLRTPKYRLRTEESKVKYIRKPKHKGSVYGLSSHAEY